MEQMVMTPFCSPLSLAHPDPVGGLVTGTLEPLLFHEGLEQVNVMVINVESILRDSSGIERQDF